MNFENTIERNSLTMAEIFRRGIERRRCRILAEGGSVITQQGDSFYREHPDGTLLLMLRGDRRPDGSIHYYKVSEDGHEFLNHIRLPGGQIVDGCH